MRERVLITGGSGFIGSHLMEAFQRRGFKVFNADLEGQPPVDIRRFRVLADLFERVKPDLVLHLAALSSIPLCERFPKRTYETNVVGTLNVARLASKMGVRVIYASSSAVYGDRVSFPTSEDCPTDPVNHYGVSKLAGEKILRNLLPDNLVILRIFNVYGPRSRIGVINDVFRKIASGSRLITMKGVGDEKRDFIYISDVVDAFLKAVEYDEYEVFNIGFGSNLSIRELVSRIASLLKDLDLKFEFEGKPRKGDFKENCADISKAVKKLGWKPKIGLDQGLRLTAKYFLGGKIKK